VAAVAPAGVLQETLVVQVQGQAVITVVPAEPGQQIKVTMVDRELAVLLELAVVAAVLAKWDTLMVLVMVATVLRLQSQGRL
jgi:hypothetical protein